MTRVSKAWQSELIERYPRLFLPDGGAPESAPGYPSCHEGWFDLLDRACRRIADVLTPHDKFVIDQVKEKMGGLRIYWSGQLDAGARAAVEEAIDLAEARADCTCERCGAEGRLRVSDHWFATACDEHAKGRPVEIRPGIDNLHVVRSIGKDGSRVISCRRYDRETDTFIDIDPSSVEIEE
jgi:hypothetical protein